MTPLKSRNLLLSIKLYIIYFTLNKKEKTREKSGQNNLVFLQKNKNLWKKQKKDEKNGKKYRKGG